MVLYASSATGKNDEKVNYRVVCVAFSFEDNLLLAQVYYSAKTESWGDLISIPFLPDDLDELDGDLPDMIIENTAVLVGDSLYWQMPGTWFNIIEYDLKRESLDVIELPVDMLEMLPACAGCFWVIREQGGGLGIFSVADFTALFWKRNTDRDSVGSWVLERTIELDDILHLDRDKEEFIMVMAYAEENNYVILETVNTSYMLQLQSLKYIINDARPNFHPFECVYTPGNKLVRILSYFRLLVHGMLLTFLLCLYVYCDLLDLLEISEDFCNCDICSSCCQGKWQTPHKFRKYFSVSMC